MNTIKLSGVTVIYRNSFYQPANQNNNIGYIPEYHRDCAIVYNSYTSLSYERK